MIEKEQIFKYRVRLSKEKDSLTHHEKRKMLQQALIAGGLDCALNKGQPRMNLGPGAGVGEASLCEYADICLAQQTDIETIIKKLAAHITGGFKIESIKEVPYMLSSVENLAQYAKYNIKGIKCEGGQSVQEPFIYSIKKINGEEMEIIIKLDILRSLGMAQILTMLPGLEVEEHKLEILRSALLWQKADGGLAAV